MNIPTDAFVLEIGPGARPQSRADVVADKYLFEPTERNAAMRVDRPAVICDIHALPFLDKSFDFVIASQVLEHVQNPELAIWELARVGRAGWIETPTILRETLFGWPFHRWIIENDNGQLNIMTNDAPQPFQDIFHTLAESQFEFAEFCTRNKQLLDSRLEWKDFIPYSFVPFPAGRFSGGNHDSKIHIPAEQRHRHRMDSWLKIVRRCTRIIMKYSPVAGLLRRARDQMQILMQGRRNSTEASMERLELILACPRCKVRPTPVSCHCWRCDTCSAVFRRYSYVYDFCLRN